MENEIDFISNDIKYKSEPLAMPILPKVKNTNGSLLEKVKKTEASKIRLQEYSNVRFGDVYTQTGDGTYIAKYPTYITTGGNQEEFQAKKQTASDQTTNGLLKAGATALTGVIGGTVGAVYGLMDSVRTGNFSSVYDNDFNKVLDNWNEKLRYELPNYYTEAEKKMSLGDKLISGGSNFWANDFAGGLGFTVGAIGSELIWDFATGGGAVSTAGARLGAKYAKFLGSFDDVVKGVNKTKNFAKEPLVSAAKTGFRNVEVPTRLATGLGKTGEFLNTVRFTYTSAGTEAGMEARHYMREMEDDYYRDFAEKNNGAVPTYEQDQQFRADLEKSANALFGFNLAVVGASNLATIGRILNVKSPSIAPTKWVNSKLFGVGVNKAATGELTAIAASKGQKVAQNVWGLVRSPIIEGLWEEGLQSVGKNTAKNWIQAGYNPKLTKETYGLGQATIDGFAQTYGTKEGWNEVGLGMLIGLFTGTGINLAQGRGLTGEFKDKNLEAKNLENYSKYYSPKKVSESILYANRSQQAAANQEEAEARGDFTSSELARKDAVVSQLNFGYNLDYFDETVEDTLLAIDNLDDESLVKQYGEDPSQTREKLKAEYKKTAEDYKRYRDFSEYFVGNNLKKEGLNKEETSNLKQAIAYELTLGNEAYRFSSEILNTLKSKIASGYTDVEITNAIDIDNILLTASQEVKAQFDSKVQEVKQTTEKKKQLEIEKDRLLKVLLDESQEQKTTRLQKLNNVEVELQELEIQRQALEKETDAILSAAKLNNPFNTEPSSQFLTLEQIENLDTNLNKVKDLAGSFRSTDPQRALEIQKLREEYARSITAFQRYADLARQLSDPKLGFKGKRNIISEIRSPKTMNEVTVETLEGLSGTRNKLKVESAERILSSSEVVEETIDSAKKDLEQQEADTIELKTKEVVVEDKPKKSPLEVVKEIIKNNPYLLSYKGEGVIPGKPTEQELTEYYDLAKRALSSPNFDPETIGMTGQLSMFSTGENLTEDELARLKELNQKMSDWQLYSGAVNEEGVSIADVMEQELLLQQTAEEEVSPDVTPEELSEMSNQEPSIVDEEKPRYEDIAQTYSRVFVRAMKDYFSFHNIGIQKLLDGLDIANTVTVTQNGKTFDVSRGDLQQYSQEDTKFTVTFRDGSQAEFLIAGGGTIRTENFKKVADNSKYKIDRYTLGKQSGYSLLYDGNEQVESDFSRIDGSLSYSDLELYNLPEGEVINFEVNLNDPWNVKQLEAYKQHKDKAKLEATLKIYIVDANGNILGDVKANRDVEGVSPGFLQLRAEAVDRALDKKAPSRITLNYQAPVKHLFLGVPNFSFDDNGNHTAYDIEPIMVVDFGYTQGGNLVLKNGTKEKVRKDLISKVLNKDGVPVIVFRQGEHLIAFPVKLKKANKGLSEQVDDIINNSTKPSDIAVQVNNILKQNNLSPKKYNLYYTDANNQTLFDEEGDLTAEFQKAKEDLGLKEDYIKPEDWNTVDDVIASAVINVNLADKPLVSPKPIIDFDAMNETPTDVYERYQINQELTEEEITDFANKAIDALMEMAQTKEEIREQIREADQQISQAKQRIVENSEGKARLNIIDGFEQIDGYAYRSSRGTVWIVPSNDPTFTNEGEAVNFVVLRDGKLFNSWKRAENKRVNDIAKNPAKIGEINRAFTTKITRFLIEQSEEYLTEIPKAGYNTKDANVAINFETSISNNEAIIKKQEEIISKLEENLLETVPNLDKRDATIIADPQVQRKIKSIIKNNKSNQAQNNLNIPC